MQALRGFQAWLPNAESCKLFCSRGHFFCSRISSRLPRSRHLSPRALATDDVPLRLQFTFYLLIWHCYNGAACESSVPPSVLDLALARLPLFSSKTSPSVCRLRLVLHRRILRSCNNSSHLVLWPSTGCTSCCASCIFRMLPSNPEYRPSPR